MMLYACLHAKPWHFQYGQYDVTLIQLEFHWGESSEMEGSCSHERRTFS